MKKRFFTTLLAISALGLTLTSCGETTNDPENVQYVYIPYVKQNNFHEARSESEYFVEYSSGEAGNVTDIPTGEMERYVYDMPFFQVDHIVYPETGSNLIEVYYWRVGERFDYRDSLKEDWKPAIEGYLESVSISNFNIDEDSVYIFSGTDPLTSTNLAKRNFVSEYWTSEEMDEYQIDEGGLIKDVFDIAGMPPEYYEWFEEQHPLTSNNTEDEPKLTEPTEEIPE